MCAFGVVIICALAKYFNHPGIYSLFKDMSGYVLLAVGPYVAYLFQRRGKFVELLQEEWRKVGEVKQDIISYCQKGKSDIDQYIDLYSNLSIAIDNMRALFRNVGESEEYIGLYPYETLHDFRRQLETIDPRKGPVSAAAMKDASRNIVSSFQAFRDIFLIELSPVEPDFPIIAHNLKRLRKPGVDPGLLQRMHEKNRATMRHFKIEGDAP